jgi:hypothetical protein
MVGPGAGDGDTTNAGSYGGRVEELMDMAAWIDRDRLEFIKMGEGEDGAGDLPSPGGTTLGLLASEEAGQRRGQRSAGDVGERPCLNNREVGAGRGSRWG